MLPQFYQHVLALVFAVNEINENPKILSNVTLGFHIYDISNDAKMTYRTTLDLLFKLHRYFPNYECDEQKNVMAVIGGLEPDMSLYMANILHLYKIPQLPYGSFTLKQNAKHLTSMFYMVSNTSHQHLGITLLLQHFGWRWVGLFVSDDDYGEHFLQVLEPLLSQSEICLAFTERIVNKPHVNSIYDIFSVASSMYQPLTDSKANVIILYGESFAIPVLCFRLLLGSSNYKEKTSLTKVWVVTAKLDFIAPHVHGDFDSEYFHGTISFKSHSSELLEFQKFVQSIKPPGKHGDGFFKDFWEQAFDCTFTNTLEARDGPDTCTGQERLGSLSESVFRMRMTGHSYTIYNALYAVGHALQLIYSSRARQRLMRGRGRAELQDVQPWQVMLPQSNCAPPSTDLATLHKICRVGSEIQVGQAVTADERSRV